MNKFHPEEAELQQYVMEKSGCPVTVIQHIELCPQCMEAAETYKSLFIGIQQQPKAAFDFDVSELVLSQLPKTKPRLSAEDFIAGFLICFMLGCIAAPLYLFRKRMAELFMDTPPFFIYTMIISTLLFLVYTLISIYKKYQERMRILNFN